MILPPEAADWVREHEIPQPPKGYSGTHLMDMEMTYPQVGGHISGVVAIRGSAKSNDFQRYKLEYGEGLSPEHWIPIGDSHDRPVTNNVLENFDTKELEGLYSLRLSVITKQDGTKTVTIPITIDNTPPSVKVVYPYAGSVLQLIPLRFDAIGIQAEAKDNIGIDRVEMFVGDDSLGYTTVFPYNREWKLTLGVHKIHAVAYDKAGSKTESEPITIQVIPEE